MNGWQKLLYKLRNNNPVRKKFIKRNDFKNFDASNENYFLPSIGANGYYSNIEEIPNDFMDFVDGINQMSGSIPKAKRYFKESPIPYWQQDIFYHDFM